MSLKKLVCATLLSLFNILNGNSSKLCMLAYCNIYHYYSLIFLRSYHPFCNTCYILKREFDKALHASLIPYDDSRLIDIEGVIVLFYFQNIINWFEYTNPPTYDALK